MHTMVKMNHSNTFIMIAALIKPPLITVSLVDCWSYQSFVTFKKVSLTHPISSDGLENFFIYPTWVKENCKKFSGQNTVWNMVKIHFEKYEKVEKIQNFELTFKQMS